MIEVLESLLKIQKYHGDFSYICMEYERKFRIIFCALGLKEGKCHLKRTVQKYGTEKNHNILNFLVFPGYV